MRTVANSPLNLSVSVTYIRARSAAQFATLVRASMLRLDSNVFSVVIAVVIGSERHTQDVSLDYLNVSFANACAWQGYRSVYARVTAIKC
jgi:hypothetical protein